MSSAKNRPNQASLISALPFGSPCAFDRRGQEKSAMRGSWNFQTIS